MYSHRISFLDSYSIIYRRQYGFRKSHFTIHALINIVERIRQSLDKGHALGYLLIYKRLLTL